MKNILIIITLLFAWELQAQSIVSGSLASTGASITGTNSGSMNFTLGQPFGLGDMEEGDLVIIDGVQGSSITVEEISSTDNTPTGISNYDELSATILFDPQSGSIFLRGEDIQELNGNLLLTSVSGKVIQNSRVQNGNIDVVQWENLIKGIYVLTIISDDQKVLSKKLFF